jgi:hypothetical protein
MRTESVSGRKAADSRKCATIAVPVTVGWRKTPFGRPVVPEV